MWIIEAVVIVVLVYKWRKAEEEARFYKVYKNMLQKLNTAYEKKYGKLSVNEELDAIYPTAGLSVGIK